MIFCFNQAHELVIWQHSEEDLHEYGTLYHDDYIYFFADIWPPNVIIDTQMIDHAKQLLQREEDNVRSRVEEELMRYYFNSDIVEALMEQI
jgi:hypothetical protein